MKVQTKYSIALFVIGIILILIDTLGLYQLEKVHVNDITISKPLGYKYSSVSSSDSNSTKKLFQNIHGLQTRHTLNNSVLLSLQFEQRFLSKKTIIYFTILSKIDKKYLTIQDENLKCTKLEITDKDEQYISRIIYKSSININILSNNKKDVTYFYKQVCD